MLTFSRLISRAAHAAIVCGICIAAGAPGFAPHAALAAEEVASPPAQASVEAKEKENLTPAQVEARAKMKPHSDAAKKATDAGDYATAEREYNAMETIAPELLKPSFFTRRGFVRLQLLKFKEMDEDLTKALQLSEQQNLPMPDAVKVTTYTWLGVARQELGKYDESAEFARKILALPALSDTNKAVAISMLGISLYCKGDMEGAIQAWKPLVELTAPEHVGHSVAGCNYIWVANARLGREAEATRELDAILRKKATHRKSSWQFGIGLYLMGKLPANTLLDATSTVPDEDKKLSAVCQGHFFIAAKLMSTDKTEARKHLVKCLESKVTSVMPEKVMAAADLKRLDAAIQK